MNFFMSMLMTIMIVYMFYKNTRLLKRTKHNRNYIEAYDSILKEDSGAYEKVLSYIENEDDLEFKNKGKILKLLLEMDVEGDQYKDTLDSIDFDVLYLENGKMSNEKLQLNSDTFMWVILALCKAVDYELDDVSQAIHNKFCNYEKILDGNLEYHLIQGVYECLNDKEGENFLTALLEGDYPSFKYDKRMIGLYKRLAAAVLEYKHQLTDEYFKNDLYEFAKTFMGRLVLKALDLYDIYISGAEVIEDENVSEEAAGYLEAEAKQEEVKEEENKEE